MKGLASLAVGVVVLCGSVYWFALRSPASAERVEARPGAAAAQESSPGTGTLEDTRIAVDRTKVQRTEPAGQEEPVAAEESPAQGASEVTLGARQSVRGIVVDPGALALPGVRVLLEGTQVSAVSDGAGRFRLEAPAKTQNGTITVEDLEWTAIRTSNLDPDSFVYEHVVIALPAIDVSGRVVDPLGVPVSADLQLQVAKDFERTFPFALDRSKGVRRLASTEEDGSFALEGVPSSSPAFAVFLEASARGFEPARVELPPVSTTSFIVRLTPKQAEASLRGRVLLPDGTAAEGATVRFGRQTVLAQKDGGFAFSVDDWFHDETALAAGLAGYGPAVVPDVGRLVLEARPSAPAPLTLTLSDVSHAIAGRVVDASGGPLADWIVDVIDADAIVPGLFPAQTAENLLTGREFLRSDDEGRFRLEGLLNRAYSVRAFEDRTFLSMIAEDVSVGTEDLLLRLEAGSALERVRGVVVAADGTPVENAQVSVGFFIHRTESGSYHDSGEPVLTDAAGAFELLEVPRQRVHLVIEGEAVVPRTFEFEGGEDVEALVVSVHRRCHFRLLTSTSSYEELVFSVLDEEGQHLSIYSFSGNGWSSSTQWKVDAESTRVYSVGESARTLVFSRKGEELQRGALELDPLVVGVVRAEVP